MPSGVYIRKKRPLSSVLNGRELEIIQMIADGLVNKEIGWELDIGRKRTTELIGIVYRKMGIGGVGSRVRLVRLAIKKGLVKA